MKDTKSVLDMHLLCTICMFNIPDGSERISAMVENVISVMEPALSIGSASVIDGFIRPKSMQQVYIRAYIEGRIV